ncbi:M15 family metallopeptidase [Mesonia sp. K4-1]|uniref:M15 family metallopeptidase n=1 Tax=Mesonia sp. K4-1 TaxID=2602760 RepID=UPI0011C84E57|nr:M15 family metallopeptidase [Mesonia sp. K4-1]TXK76459.1 M15 family metallopeptidase [Mesonia sp. K4-1]
MYKWYLILFFLLNYKGYSQAQEIAHLTNLEEVSKDFTFDIKYATEDNFLEKKIYDCSKCLLLPKVADALIAANNYFCEFGYQIKLFDCYRPLSAQKVMWDIFPNAMYVANPYKNKSVHNRAAAVDLTLVDFDDCELDMGTTYDFFGKEAHQDNFNLPEVVLQNRKLLREGMKKFGFNPIRTEWWHYDFSNAYSFPVLNSLFDCD